jgi:hypothetical protein
MDDDPAVKPAERLCPQCGRPLASTAVFVTPSGMTLTFVHVEPIEDCVVSRAAPDAKG